RVRVPSEPPDGLVRLDGQPIGTTPLESSSLSPGHHEIRLERRGYAPASQKIDGRAGDVVEVSLSLERLREEMSPSPPSPSPPRRAAQGELVPRDDAATPPRRIKGEVPPYPEVARRFRMKGAVTVDMLIDEHGMPQDFHLVESAGDLLDKAVLEAVRNWKYEPARKDGVKVKVRYRYRSVFELPS